MSRIASTVLSLLSAGGLAAQDPPKAPQLTRAQVEKIVADYLAKNAPAKPESTLDGLLVFGDMRMREEFEFERVGRADRLRFRMRLRLGATLAFSDEWELGARLRTGDPDNPTSPHVTFGDGFDSIEVALDRAYIAYHPEWLPGSSTYIGKFGHSFARNPVFGELVWDDDLQPEGVLFRLAPGSREDDSLWHPPTLRLAAYSLQEQAGQSESVLTAAELRTAFRPKEDVVARASVAYYHLHDSSPDGHRGLIGDNRGNRVADRDLDGKLDSFVEHFGIVHGNVSAEFEDDTWPVRVAAEYIRNVRANTADTGWGIGISCGHMQKRGQVMGYYQWSVVEREAVFSPFVQDDFFFATGFRGHVFGVNYQARDQVGINLWALVSRAETTTIPGGDRDEWRLRLDLNVRF